MRKLPAKIFLESQTQTRAQYILISHVRSDVYEEGNVLQNNKEQKGWKHLAALLLETM